MSNDDCLYDDGMVAREIARQGFKTLDDKAEYARRRAVELRGQTWGGYQDLGHRVSTNENDRIGRAVAFERYRPTA